MRLIDGDAFRDLMWSLAYDDWNQGINISLADAFRGCVRRVEEAPAVDAVPVVRCGECRYWDRFPSCSATPQYHACKRRIFAKVHTTRDDFCSKGERKDSDGK